MQSVSKTHSRKPQKQITFIIVYYKKGARLIFHLASLLLLVVLLYYQEEHRSRVYICMSTEHYFSSVYSIIVIVFSLLCVAFGMVLTFPQASFFDRRIKALKVEWGEFLIQAIIHNTPIIVQY